MKRRSDRFFGSKLFIALQDISGWMRTSAVCWSFNLGWIYRSSLVASELVGSFE